MARPSAIEQLKLTPYFYKLAVRRHKLHVETCKSIGCEPDSFEFTAEETINALKLNREETAKSMLKPEPQSVPVPAGPVTRYRQYDTPIVAEMYLGGTPGTKKKGGKK